MEQALEVRTPIWGIGGGGAHHGGLAAAMQVGSGEPATAGRKRGGEHRLGVHGAAVSSGGGHCGDGGAHRWPEVALDGKAVAGSVLRRFLAADGGSAACSRGSEAHESGAGWLALRRLEQRSTTMREQRQTVRAEQSGRRSVVVTGRGEMTSPTDQQCDEVRHGAVTACVACGKDMAASR
jgi:hypothetical protein